MPSRFAAYVPTAYAPSMNGAETISTVFPRDSETLSLSFLIFSRLSAVSSLISPD